MNWNKSRIVKEFWGTLGKFKFGFDIRAGSWCRGDYIIISTNGIHESRYEYIIIPVNVINAF